MRSTITPDLTGNTTMAEIVLSTLNARYHHCAFGLRYLQANLGALQNRSVLWEFQIQQKPLEIVEKILSESPRIVGLGVYIWNAEQTAEVVALLKRIDPGVVIVLGGPEVSYPEDLPEWTEAADYLIGGEADTLFPWICGEVLHGRRPERRWISAPPPKLEDVKMPYGLYSAEDVENRIVYVEASRGCPFTCDFCLSALDIPVRQFPLEPFLSAMASLWNLGVRHFKFVDRTFNLNLKVSRRILEFFRARYEPGSFLHFEMIPDRLPDGLRRIIAQFPPGALQFEVGIQTFDEAVAARIHRRQDIRCVEENLRFLREQTGVHVHADLIAGLPGESMEGFGRGFDRLVALGPQEIQVGILKRLRGAPIARHSDTWEMVYSPYPPYEILRHRNLTFTELNRLRRFARYWDLTANSGRFVQTVPLLWTGKISPFQAFLDWSDWLYARVGRTHSIDAFRLAQYLFEFLVGRRNQDPRTVARALRDDLPAQSGARPPKFLRAFLSDEEPGSRPGVPLSRGKRQARHLVHSREIQVPPSPSGNF